MRFEGDKFLAEDTELDKIIVGTVTGKFIVVRYNDTSTDYDIMWDSGEDERYSLGAGIWDMEYIPTHPDVPIWRLLGPSYPQFTPPSFDNLGGGIEYNSWTYGQLAPEILPSTPGNYLIGTKNGTIVPLDSLGVVDGDMELIISDINTNAIHYYL